MLDAGQSNTVNRTLYTYMSSRIQSHLLIVDGALHSCPSRALLKGGSIDAWAACSTTLQAVLPVLRELLADQSGAAAVSMQWRKSSASKKLLALLRAAIELAHALPFEAAPTAAACTVRCRAVHDSIYFIILFWTSSQPSATGTLWPAMREWIVELGGIRSLWTVLAWVILIPVQDFEAADAIHQLLRVSVRMVLYLTNGMFSLRRPVELAKDSAFTTVMSRLLSVLLPRDFVAGNAHTWDLDTVFIVITTQYQLEGSMLPVHLLKPMLVFWPFLFAELRRQRRLLQESAGAYVPPGHWRLGVKVNIHTGHAHLGSFCVGVSAHFGSFFMEVLAIVSARGSQLSLRSCLTVHIYRYAPPL